LKQWAEEVQSDTGEAGKARASSAVDSIATTSRGSSGEASGVRATVAYRGGTRLAAHDVAVLVGKIVAVVVTSTSVVAGGWGAGFMQSILAGLVLKLFQDVNVKFRLTRELGIDPPEPGFGPSGGISI